MMFQSPKIGSVVSNEGSIEFSAQELAEFQSPKIGSVVSNKIMETIIINVVQFQSPKIGSVVSNKIKKRVERSLSTVSIP